MLHTEIREIDDFAGFNACLDLQRAVFRFPELEVSPVRHLIVTKNAGGFTLGAFDGPKLIGMAVTVPAFRGPERIYYSHMACVLTEYQGRGVGAELKWTQRARALEAGVGMMKWTFQPVRARNAYFNLEKLGVVVRRYLPNYYGTGFTNEGVENSVDSDRLFAEWTLESEKVRALSDGRAFIEDRAVKKTIGIPPDWDSLLRTNPEAAAEVQRQIRNEFESAFASGLVCASFVRDPENPCYLFFGEK